ncbi:hypothetical protein [Desulfacinum infernum]|uniref:hypothetical protein n=1 Tax=Desulfacinum infernum TaxID=35837 RepID=UPI0011606A0E|nr:hypothetical protein [Desulfacinum infernum]
MKVAKYCVREVPRSCDKMAVAVTLKNESGGRFLGRLNVMVYRREGDRIISGFSKVGAAPLVEIPAGEERSVAFMCMRKPDEPFIHLEYASPSGGRAGWSEARLPDPIERSPVARIGIERVNPEDGSVRVTVKNVGEWAIADPVLRLSAARAAHPDRFLPIGSSSLPDACLAPEEAVSHEVRAAKGAIRGDVLKVELLSRGTRIESQRIPLQPMNVPPGRKTVRPKPVKP